MTATDIATGELPPTSTYHKRRWCWVPVPSTDRIGTLTIVLQKGRRGRGTDEIDSYGVQEDADPAFPAHDIRVFLLKNDTDLDQHEVYAVVVGESHQSCSCKAAKCKTPSCKHADTLTQLVAEGLL
jgi:hypothetical protein